MCKVLSGKTVCVQQEKMSVFYERLYEALEILVDFFHADQKGLPLESIKSGKTGCCQKLTHMYMDSQQYLYLHSRSIKQAYVLRWLNLLLLLVEGSISQSVS
jgi:hypothetical protein